MDLKDQLTQLQWVPVVAFEEGKRLGRMQDIFIDKEAKRIRGISFRRGIWRKEGEAYVDRADILRFGKDVVIVSRASAATLLPEGVVGCSLRRLRGVKISTAEGAYIGEVVDLEVDRESGAIAEIVMTDNRVLEVDVDDIVLGPDVIMVPVGYADRIQRPEDGKHGILGRMFAPAAVTDTLRDRYEEIVASVRGGKGEKMFERTRDTVIRTSRKIQETIEQMRQRPEREAGAAPSEGEEFQGVEAEHAGRTYPGQDAGPLPETSASGPYTERVENAGPAPRTETPRE